MAGKAAHALINKTSMARFYIKLDAPYPVDDHEGEIYANAASAREDAICFLAELLKDRRHEIMPGDRWRVTISDDEAKTVCTLDFAVR